MPGQTLSQVRALLAGAGLTPRHRFGQNFLIDLNLMRKAAAAAELSAADVVLEVGPGTGSLTELLLAPGARVIAVEIDRGLQALLAAQFAGQPRFTLICGDALATKHELNPELISALQRATPAERGARKLVANLPYQIATPLLMELLYGDPPLERMVITIQQEVAERLTAAPRTDAYGPLAVIMQSLAQLERLARLPASAFWPRPAVESELVRIRPRGVRAVAGRPTAGYVALVRTWFQHRRKTLRRIARDAGVNDAEAAFARSGISSDARPEELSAADWERLFGALPTVLGAGADAEKEPA
ncbi:MAG: 16S rRNA (adenine(1518)-N(6)/adenine(1519)-N(6))-dimethyltransferase RsmA [Phycisphaerae bacterium]